jgi:hypothetical protein
MASMVLRNCCGSCASALHLQWGCSADVTLGRGCLSVTPCQHVLATALAPCGELCWSDDKHAGGMKAE